MPTVEAQVVGLTEKTAGWWRLETDTRPRFLDTKRPDLIELARQLLRDRTVAVIEYNERQSGNINPHTNTPYINYFFEGAITGTAPASRSNGDQAPEQRAAKREPEYGWRTNPVDAWRMTLGVAAKLAILTLPLLPPTQQDPESQWRLTLWWANRIFNAEVPQTNPLDEPEPQWPDGREDFGY